MSLRFRCEHPRPELGLFRIMTPAFRTPSPRNWLCFAQRAASLSSDRTGVGSDRAHPGDWLCFAHTGLAPNWVCFARYGPDSRLAGPRLALFRGRSPAHRIGFVPPSLSPRFLCLRGEFSAQVRTNRSLHIRRTPLFAVARKSGKHGNFPPDLAPSPQGAYHALPPLNHEGRNRR
jgi:hypothetical protein